MTSQKWIARQCGVSLITVSRALDPLRCEKVKPATRQKILELCEKENFYPSFSARALASGSTRSIGLIVPGIGMISNSPQSAVYLSTFTEELEKRGYNVVLLPVSGSDWASISRNAEQLILSNRCDGYVTVAFTVDLPPELPVTVLQTTASGKITTDNYPVIEIDSRPAMTGMIGHLQAQGYKRPLFISFGDRTIERISQWKNAFANSAMTMQELHLPPSRINCSGDAEMLKILQNHLPEMREFDIWLFGNDQWAMLAAVALESAGLTPGKDIALIGFDNIEKNCPDAFLSTIAPPLEEFGKEAAKMVLDRVKHKNREFSNINVRLESEAVFRRSTCKQQLFKP